jgi:hypothetical protein
VLRTHSSRRLSVATVAAVGSMLMLMALAVPSGAAARGKPTTRLGHVGGIVLARGAHSLAPTANGTPPLLYHGGKVMQKQSTT